ncbi:hypothetical protein EEB14_43635 [Rhodococcus sp. WS4]|nr:hypothetical protein EEB14_43635 [Rhodococcus sp. WS4]
MAPFFFTETPRCPHERSLLPACDRTGGRESKLGVHQFEMVSIEAHREFGKRLPGAPRGRAAA